MLSTTVIHVLYETVSHELLYRDAPHRYIGDCSIGLLVTASMATGCGYPRTCVSFSWQNPMDLLGPKRNRPDKAAKDLVDMAGRLADMAGKLVYLAERLPSPSSADHNRLTALQDEESLMHGEILKRVAH